MSITQFDKIYHGVAAELGKFRMANQGVAWKALEGESSIAIPQGDIKWAEWIRVARNFQLRIGLSTSKATGKNSERTRETFDGFQRDDQEKVGKLLKQFYDIVLEIRDTTFKGWNWGATDFRGQDLAFLVSNKTVFELPLSSVTNSNMAGKAEVSLEFSNSRAVNGSGRKPARAPDELVEMRFYIPGTRIRQADSEDEDGEKVEKKKKKKDSVEREGSDKEGSDKEGEGKGSDADEEGDEDDQNAAQQFHSLIRERASLTSQTAAGSLLVSFDDVLVTTPRGRYDVAMYQTFLRLRGKTYDYKILYTSISRLFLLPKDEQSVQFIVGLSPPIRQGQTRYSYLVMHFPRDQEMEAEINMEQEAIDEAYAGKLEKHYDAPAFQVVSSVFRALSGKKVIGQSREDAQGIKCNLKANPGEMHLLEKSIIYIGKQPIFIELNEIHQVLFSRVGNVLGTARTFDLTIETKSGPSYTFNAVNRDEHEMMENYMKSKKIRVTNQMADDVLNDLIGEDDDEEMQSIASSDSEEPEVRRGGDVDDEDSEADEDFKASSSDGGSPSSGGGSDSDSDASDDSSAKKAKSKSKPSAKAKGKAKASSDAEASPPKSKKKKAHAADSSKDKSPTGAKKPKPKPKPKAKDAGDAMDVDEEGPSSKKKSSKDAPSKPRPKPKPAAKSTDSGEPAKKKLKKDSSD